MKVGTTSFGFRYLLLDRTLAPPLEEIVERTRVCGLRVLQICENARPLELSGTEWRSLLRYADDAGIEIQLGCKTLDGNVLEQYLARAADMPRRFLRVVFEDERGAPPTRAAVERLLEAAWPALERAGTRLAIENHFDVPSRMLAEVAQAYPASQVGFCVDTANSLRNFEPPELVMELLGPRAYCYHLKDFRVEGTLLGFTVGGAPLGSGRMNLDWILDTILATNPQGELFLENWVPATGARDQDIHEDQRWLRLSLETLESRLRARGIPLGQSTSSAQS